MTNKFKLEKWKKTQWKGTKRETITTTERLVKRDSKGHFLKVIKDVRTKSYGSGVYQVGYVNDKPITRWKIGNQKMPEWYKAKEEKMKTREIFRTSYVLNNIPFRGEVYYGFRITAFSYNKELLHNLRTKLKEILIKFIEKCLGYKQDEFWFSTYFGYESPSKIGASRTENGKYYLLWQKRYGAIVKEESHLLGDM